MKFKMKSLVNSEWEGMKRKKERKNSMCQRRKQKDPFQKQKPIKYQFSPTLEIAKSTKKFVLVWGESNFVPKTVDNYSLSLIYTT